MRAIAGLVVLVVALGGCSNTDAPEPEPTASTVLQQDVDDFCDDVRDAISKGQSTDPEDQAERLTELHEAAQSLGVGTRDDMYAAEALTACKDELEAAINNPSSPQPTTTP